MVISKKTIIFPGFRGSPIFFRAGVGVGRTFSRGVEMLFSIESHITCDFPGVLTPPPQSN